ncbi:MAG TPA: recombinase family protein [Gammaproteobacteria bacterium]|nr:recombinase family protein [Gammaproteobacteria bacterium]
MGQKVALYCRVSTADQSCERQERDLLAFAARAGQEVVGVWKETASGAKQDRLERQKVMALAQARSIEAIVVTELTRWGRSTIDLVHTLNDLQAWGVSLIAQTGLQFDLRTAQGKLVASLMSALAEFERDLLRERIRSGIAAAKARGKQFGRHPGHRIKSDRLAPKVLQRVEKGGSYREIGKELNISKNTVGDIVKRHRLSKG